MKYGYIYVGVSGAIVIFGIFLIYQLHNNVEIQDIHVQPDTIKVGDIFTVNATLVNNSQNPIYVHNGYFCGSRFFVVFDSHVTVHSKPMTVCAIAELVGKINPSEKIITVAPDSIYAFRATESGITTATITFTYYGTNADVDPKTISKSFSFTILDK